MTKNVKKVDCLEKLWNSICILIWINDMDWRI